MNIDHILNKATANSAQHDDKGQRSSASASASSEQNLQSPFSMASPSHRFGFLPLTQQSSAFQSPILLAPPPPPPPPPSSSVSENSPHIQSNNTIESHQHAQPALEQQYSYYEPAISSTQPGLQSLSPYASPLSAGSTQPWQHHQQSPGSVQSVTSPRPLASLPSPSLPSQAYASTTMASSQYVSGISNDNVQSQQVNPAPQPLFGSTSRRPATDLEIVDETAFAGSTFKRRKAPNSTWTIDEDRKLVDLVLRTLPRQDFAEYAQILNKRDGQTVRYRWKVLVRRAKAQTEE
ncbi:hypothetical protein V1514DRAFT_318345 [Lipomyces japonicus]|uniref:uncharacterized protein n=1 Tax=Lipomyces japonicus TaxID=56871 RepID=UPI0034CDCA7E